MNQKFGAKLHDPHQEKTLQQRLIGPDHKMAGARILSGATPELVTLPQMKLKSGGYDTTSETKKNKISTLTVQVSGVRSPRGIIQVEETVAACFQGIARRGRANTVDGSASLEGGERSTSRNAIILQEKSQKCGRRWTKRAQPKQQPEGRVTRRLDEQVSRCECCGRRQQFTVEGKGEQRKDVGKLHDALGGGRVPAIDGLLSIRNGR
jgi:hypothetical protein